MGAIEQQRLPTMKTEQISRMVLCRPQRSESRLQVSAPITAPSRIPAAMDCSIAWPVSNSLPICSRAPEMIPVS